MRQIYALAAALCEKHGWEWPETRDDASDLIEAIRIETGHPSPGLDDAPVRGRRRRRRRGDPASWERIALAKQTVAALTDDVECAAAASRLRRGRGEA